MMSAMPKPPTPVTVGAVLVAVLATLLLTGGRGSPETTRATPRPGVSASLRQLVTDGDAPGAAALSQGKPSRPGAGKGRRGSWFGTAGVADLRSDRRIRVDDRFRAGSLTKTFVATVVLQLAAEGRLGLTDIVDRHLPAVVRGNGNDGRRITIRQLLGHTSGLYDYTEDPQLKQRIFDSGFPRHRLDSYRPEQLIGVALRHPPYFAAGTGYRYSNTDYILLGMVVERVTGRPYAEEVQRRILRPLSLTGTSFPGTRAGLPAPHGRGYSAAQARGRTDVTVLDPSRAGAAGEAVSTLQDLNRFLRALLGGRMLAPEQLRQMRNTSGSRGMYGLGLFPVRLGCGVTLWGHNGSISGSYVQALGTADGRHVLSYRVNTDSIADRRAETRLLEAEFCPARGSARERAGRPADESAGR